MKLCRGLASEGRAIAAVLHDIPLALKYADNMIVMSNGKIVLSGTTSDVYKSGVLNRVFNVKVKEAAVKTDIIYYCE